MQATRTDDGTRIIRRVALATCVVVLFGTAIAIAPASAEEVRESTSMQPVERAAPIRDQARLHAATERANAALRGRFTTTELRETYGDSAQPLSPSDIALYAIPAVDREDAATLTVPAGTQVNPDGSYSFKEDYSLGATWSGYWDTSRFTQWGIVNVMDHGGTFCNNTYGQAIMWVDARRRTTSSGALSLDANGRIVMITTMDGEFKITDGADNCIDWIDYGYTKAWFTNANAVIGGADPITDEQGNCTTPVSFGVAVGPFSVQFNEEVCDLWQVSDFDTHVHTSKDSYFVKFVDSGNDTGLASVASALDVRYPNGQDSGRTYTTYLDPDNGKT